MSRAEIALAQGQQLRQIAGSPGEYKEPYHCTSILRFRSDTAEVKLNEHLTVSWIGGLHFLFLSIYPLFALSKYDPVMFDEFYFVLVCIECA